jgi:ATP-dependent RNA circularization protein (DNA/RNA ligase family)
MLVDVDHFLGVSIVLTEKMDGSNLCMTKEAVFARSHNGPPTHESFNFAKQLHASIRRSIPDDLSVFGEYLFAVHSIPYTNLPGYFLIFGVREDLTGKWWSWEMVKEMARELGVPTVKELYHSNIYGMFETARQLECQVKLDFLTENKGKWENGHTEGVVIRLADEFTDFPMSVAKYVRANHVTTTQHWTQKEVERNGIRGKE